MYRLILESEGAFDYDTVFNNMTPDEITEANFALDMHLENRAKALKKKT